MYSCTLEHACIVVGIPTVEAEQVWPVNYMYSTELLYWYGKYTELAHFWKTDRVHLWNSTWVHVQTTRIVRGVPVRNVPGVERDAYSTAA